MLIGPYEFEILMNHGCKKNFTLHTSIEGRKDYENEMAEMFGETYAKGSFERHVPAITGLCKNGIIGFDAHPYESDGKIGIRFSYHWTELGNNLLHLLKVISPEELTKRRESLPPHFDTI